MKEKFLIYKDGPEKFDAHGFESHKDIDAEKQKIINETRKSLDSLKSDIPGSASSEVAKSSPEFKLMRIRMEELHRKRNSSENLSHDEQIELQALEKYAEYGDSRLVKLYQKVLKQEQTKDEAIEYSVRVNNWDKSEEEKLEMIDKAIADNS